MKRHSPRCSRCNEVLPETFQEELDSVRSPHGAFVAHNADLVLQITGAGERVTSLGFKALVRRILDREPGDVFGLVKTSNGVSWDLLLVGNALTLRFVWPIGMSPDHLVEHVTNGLDGTGLHVRQWIADGTPSR